MDLVLFDIWLPKKGIMPPRDFLGAFGHLRVAELVDLRNFGPELVEDVRSERIELQSSFDVATAIPEGVVCKGVSGKRLWTCKVKTDRYREALKAVFRGEWTNYWE